MLRRSVRLAYGDGHVDVRSWLEPGVVVTHRKMPMETCCAISR